jgi:hypothetical protein
LWLARRRHAEGSPATTSMTGKPSSSIASELAEPSDASRAACREYISGCPRLLKGAE